MLTHYQSLRDLADSQLLTAIRAIRPRQLAQVRLFELIADQDQLLPLGHGICIISSPAAYSSSHTLAQHEFLYVGECKSRNFAERLSSHLAFGERCILATLRRNVIATGLFHDSNDALGFMGQCGLRLIDFGSYQTLDNECSQFEKKLQVLLAPHLNSVRGRRRK
jgi:hypothetical protein